MGVNFYDFGFGEFVPGRSISHYCHPFMIYLDTCNGRASTLDDISTTIFNLSDLYVPSKCQLKVFSIIYRVNELKSLVKHILCNFGCRFIVKIIIQIKIDNCSCMKSVFDKLQITSEDKMVNTSTCSFDIRLTWIIEQNRLLFALHYITSCRY